jgi:hypothetical protein
MLSNYPAMVDHGKGPRLQRRCESFSIDLRLPFHRQCGSVGFFGPTEAVQALTEPQLNEARDIVGQDDIGYASVISRGRGLVDQMIGSS